MVLLKNSPRRRNILPAAACGLLAACFFAGFNMARIGPAFGSGVIRERRNEGASWRDGRGRTHGKGLYVVLDSGDVLVAPPTRLWDELRKGRRLVKRRWSFNYQIDGRCFSALDTLLFHALLLGGGTAVFLGVVLRLTGRRPAA